MGEKRVRFSTGAPHHRAGGEKVNATDFFIASDIHTGAIQNPSVSNDLVGSSPTRRTNRKNKMVQILVTGPTHSGKGYIMVEIARKLRELGCDVQLQGETTHLQEKVSISDEAAAAKLLRQKVIITELQT